MMLFSFAVDDAGKVVVAGNITAEEALAVLHKIYVAESVRKAQEVKQEEKKGVVKEHE